MAYCLRCPDCRDKFPWAPSATWPRYCPLCQADIGNDRADDDIVMPFIRSAKTTATDKVYTDMVAGSEFRAQAAAEMAGVPVSEMASLKITDLNTRRDAEIMAVAPNNTVTQFMDQNPQAAGFRGGDGLGYSAGVGMGPMPNAGARMRNAIHAGHAEAVSTHAVGINERGIPTRPADAGISDRPALETQQPGYRRRA